MFCFSVYTLIKILKCDFHIDFIVLFGVYKIYFIEFEYSYRYNFTKYHQNI